MALASKIISDHDGWISVDSVPGNTVFTISLAAINVKNNFLTVRLLKWTVQYLLQMMIEQLEQF